jgi:hypothetical protein
MRSVMMRRGSLLSALLCCACLATIAPAGAEAQTLIAPATDDIGSVGVVRAVAAGRLFFAVKAPPCARKAIFYVDRTRRWVDHRYRWRFGRSGFLSARGIASGRHVLTANVVRQDGSVIHASRVVHLNREPSGEPHWVVRTHGTTGAPAGDVVVRPLPVQPPDMVGPLVELSLPKPPPAEEPPAEEPQTPPPAEEPPAEEPPAEEPQTPPPAEEPPAEEPQTPPPSEPAVPPLIDAGFENGLNNWSTAGVGEVTPTVVEDIVETGDRSGRVVLTGSENRSELILADRKEIIEMPPGTERWYSFAINVCAMVYGHPGAHNVIMQLKSSNEGSPRVSLGLWDYQGKRGLWTEGPAMDGNRFLAPLSESAWHDVTVHFKVTTGNTGFYEVYLDGKLVDSRDDITVLREGATSAYIKTGLYRNGDEIPGLSEIRVDSAKLGTTRESVEAP